MGSGANPSDLTNLNSAVLSQNKPILGVSDCWKDGLKKDNGSKGLPSLRAGQKTQKGLNHLMCYISNIKRGKHNIMCEINNGGEVNEKSRNHHS